jgi:hypothetical protein
VQNPLKAKQSKKREREQKRKLLFSFPFSMWINIMHRCCLHVSNFFLQASKCFHLLPNVFTCVVHLSSFLSPSVSKGFETFSSVRTRTDVNYIIKSVCCILSTMQEHHEQHVIVKLFFGGSTDHCFEMVPARKFGEIGVCAHLSHSWGLNISIRQHINKSQGYLACRLDVAQVGPIMPTLEPGAGASQEENDKIHTGIVAASAPNQKWRIVWDDILKFSDHTTGALKLEARRTADSAANIDLQTSMSVSHGADQSSIDVCFLVARQAEGAPSPQPNSLPTGNPPAAQENAANNNAMQVVAAQAAPANEPGETTSRDGCCRE